ncbi:hypothetical protein PFICI_05958 [Pestalotiopsis fici W106-1]|uniref:Uncharacterized protein n=1 Tax=Pestalotiopsis fici (strain W106-1 / CGMCC3.15140) TaxID=1229662 RepID=W3XF77_PESFW|nr:uncharacterized protein PFICI_05958 [Pestalotiopsis fici W106-1]ETS84082.1 hypothetical protein PFICI_05958 [Pestalotiopsis fici W106-1]
MEVQMHAHRQFLRSMPELGNGLRQRMQKHPEDEVAPLLDLEEAKTERQTIKPPLDCDYGGSQAKELGKLITAKKRLEF